MIELISYEEYLKSTQQDWETRWENVKELITFATEVTAQDGGGALGASNTEGADDDLVSKILPRPTRAEIHRNKGKVEIIDINSESSSDEEETTPAEPQGYPIIQCVAEGVADT